MNVREVMTTQVETVTPDTDLVTVARMMRDLDVGVVPVVEGNQLTGVITDRDIVIRAVADGRNLQNEQVGAHLSPNPTTIGPDANVKEAADLMAREQIRRLPVVEGGNLVGIISIGDLAVEVGKDQLVGDALEQISEPAVPRANEAAG